MKNTKAARRLEPLEEVIMFESRGWAESRPDTLLQRNGTLYLGKSDGDDVNDVREVSALEAAEWFVSSDSISDSFWGSAAKFVDILRKSFLSKN